MKFQELLKSMIIEDARLEHLLKTHAHKDIVKVNQETGKKKVKKAPLTANQLMIIVANDPTSRIQGLESTQTYDQETITKKTPEDVLKTGEYTQWMIKQYKSIPQNLSTPYGEPGFEEELSEKQRLFFEDLFDTKENLIKFHRFKSSDKISEADINKYNLTTLEDAVADLSLEMATTTKEERKSSMLHPGAEFMYEDDKWYVVKMSENSELGKEAAIYYGGSNQKTRRNETSWCTSAPGQNYYFNYLRQGPYYVIMDKTDSKKGEVSGLPAHRYQFHFESNQFMNADDRQIDFVSFFKENESLKEAFKPIIKNHFSSDNNVGTSVDINYPNDGISKIIGLFGFDEFVNNLPDDLDTFEFESSTSSRYGRDNVEPLDDLVLPESFGRFKKLSHLLLSGCVSQLPESIGELTNLNILAVPESKKLTKLPKSVANLIRNGNLSALMLKGSGVTELDQEILDAIDYKNNDDSVPIEKRGFLLVPAT